MDRGATFSFFNNSKLGITLNLKNSEGTALARRLIDWCDIVIENMRPGVMARLGLGYDVLIQSNPDLVMLSTCNMGQTGPRADTPGFGSQLSALAGFCGLTGVRDGPPMLLYVCIDLSHRRWAHPRCWPRWIGVTGPGKAA